MKQGNAPRLLARGEFAVFIFQMVKDLVGGYA
jgi:hypothetical protein